MVSPNELCVCGHIAADHDADHRCQRRAHCRCDQFDAKYARQLTAAVSAA